MFQITIINELIELKNHFSNDFITRKLLNIKLHQALSLLNTDKISTMPAEHIDMLLNLTTTFGSSDDILLALETCIKTGTNDFMVHQKNLLEAIFQRKPLSVHYPTTYWDPRNFQSSYETGTSDGEDSDTNLLIDLEIQMINEKFIPNLHNLSSFKISHPMLLELLPEDTRLIRQFNNYSDLRKILLIMDDDIIITPNLLATVVLLRLNGALLRPHIISVKQPPEIYWLFLLWIFTKLEIPFFSYPLSPEEQNIYEQLPEESRKHLREILYPRSLEFDEVWRWGLRPNVAIPKKFSMIPSGSRVSEKEAVHFLNKHNIPFLKPR